jgi:transposase
MRPLLAQAGAHGTFSASLDSVAGGARHSWKSSRSGRGAELLQLLDQLEAPIEPLGRAVEKEAKQNAAALRLMSQPGVGSITALALVLPIGPVERFESSNQVFSYLGLNPREHSSDRRRLDSISKQCSVMMRWWKRGIRWRESMWSCVASIGT